MGDRMGNKQIEGPVRKKLIFLSTGRCGTIRITQILREKLSPETFTVVHQMRFSRLANVVGNAMYYFGESPLIKRLLYSLITSRYEHGKNFISTDPLTAMIVPDQYKSSAKVLFIHITRNDISFARSMVRFTKSRFKSFIAHAFIPLWQPGVWPLETFFNKNIIDKYTLVSSRKNMFFYERFGHYSNYLQLDMKTLFTTDALARIINRWFGVNITITKEDLKIKANESSAMVDQG